VEDSVADGLLRHLKREGAYLLNPGEAGQIAALLFPGGRFDVRFVGKDATWIAAEAGLRVPGTTKVLLAPIPLVVPEQPLAHEKLCPVLGLARVPDASRGIDVARAVLRITGRGHSAAIHSTDPATIMEFGASVEVLRVSVNVGNSLGSSGISTYLAPSMTVGTGFFGRSSLTENLEPRHLVQWTRMAYNRDPAEVFGSFSGLVPWETPAGPVPPYPVASNLAGDERGPGAYVGADRTPRPGKPQPHEHASAGSGSYGKPAGGPAYGEVDTGALREVIRRIVVEELAQFAGGSRG